MLKVHSTQTTSTTLAAAAVGAVLLTGQVQYPTRMDTYEIVQPRGSHSDFSAEAVTRASAEDVFAAKVTSVYRRLSERQQRLDHELEAAIFSDVESLYEA